MAPTVLRARHEDKPYAAPYATSCRLQQKCLRRTSFQKKEGGAQRENKHKCTRHWSSSTVRQRVGLGAR